MIVITCQVASWDKPIEIDKMVGGKPLKANEFKIGDWIIIKTDQGTDLAKIIKIEERPSNIISESTTTESQNNLRILIRKANQADLDKMNKKNESKGQTLKECDELIKKHKLPMKLVDVVFHFDGGRITFAFIANTKIDFRELVKDLAQKFHKSIKLYQISVRKEAELAGDIGPCGQPVCCQTFLKKLGNVTTDLIFDQQIAHRGIDRLSGLCGRLKCCLLYEEDIYKELSKNLPAIGSLVKTSRGEGKVIDRHILKQTVMVEIDKDTVIEVPAQEINGNF
jgi:cell fate regulator YaaT (PSP1 superfamily)